tara:strand:- start:785 stop:1570 length:786 start_codon:yes stop_codon:yes gene_type:complete
MMKKYLFILFFLPTSLMSQNKDILIIEGKKYKGKLLEYSNIDIRDSESGHLTFFIDRIQDTVKIKNNSSYKMRLKNSFDFYEFEKKSWNNIEFGLNFDQFAVPHGELFLSKGIVNNKYLNPGFGIGIFTIDLINFFPIYFTNSYDILPINEHQKKESLFRVFAFNSIGYSIGTDLGFKDYVSSSGGFYLNPGFGIKKSTRNKHLSLKFGFLFQKYKSEHNFWWWDEDISFIINPSVSNSENNIIRRDGSFRRLSITLAITF